MAAASIGGTIPTPVARPGKRTTVRRRNHRILRHRQQIPLLSRDFRERTKSLRPRIDEMAVVTNQVQSHV